MNRASVEIDLQFKVLHWQGRAAVYDLDDGSRHVDIHEVSVNGHAIDSINSNHQVKAQLIEAFVAQAEADERGQGEEGDAE